MRLDSCSGIIIILLLTHDYLSVWCLNEGITLEQLHEGHLGHQQSKPHPNAAARTKPKWYVTKLRTFGSLICCKSRDKKLRPQLVACTCKQKVIHTYQDQIYRDLSNRVDLVEAINKVLQLWRPVEW